METWGQADCLWWKTTQKPKIESLALGKWNKCEVFYIWNKQESAHLVKMQIQNANLNKYIMHKTFIYIGYSIFDA